MTASSARGVAREKRLDPAGQRGNIAQLLKTPYLLNDLDAKQIQTDNLRYSGADFISALTALCATQPGCTLTDRKRYEAPTGT